MSDQTKEGILAKFLGKHTEAELREFQENKAEIRKALAKRIRSVGKATKKKPSRKQLRAWKNRNAPKENGGR